MDNVKSPNSSSPLAADVTGRSESSGVPLLAADQVGQNNSHRANGGCPLAVDETDRSKSSGLPLLAANQVDQSNSHESSGGRPLQMKRVIAIRENFPYLLLIKWIKATLTNSVVDTPLQ